MTAAALDEAMDIPSTRAYIAAVRARYDYYRKRGERVAAP
jgi:hypothetical protein